MSIIKNLINKKTSTNPPTALCCFYDGRFDSELAQIGLKLIGVKDYSVYGWSQQCASNNIKLITPQEIPNYTYDFVLCNDLISQREQLLKFTRSLHLPGLVVGHEKFPETPYHLQKRLQEANVEMISTDYTSGIKYGTQELPNIKKDIPILIEGNFQPHDHDLLKSIKREIPELVLIGHNPDLDFNIEPLFYDQYREYFARCEIFINLPTQRNISHQLLWAMSNGAIPITLPLPQLQDIFKGINDLVADNPKELVMLAKKYLGKPNPYIKQTKMVNELFPIDTFQNKWKKIINQYSKKVFVL